MSVVISQGVFDRDLPRLCWRRLAGTITASTEADGFDADFAYAEEVVNAWKPTALPANWSIEFRAPLIGPIDRDVSYVGIGAHTLGTERATVKVQVSNGAGGWV